VEKKLPSPVTWIGGKSRLLKRILPYLQPVAGEIIFVDVFGGSGVVTLNKAPHASEVYNDTDSDLVNLFRILRDPDGAVHLWWELINTPFSREEFGEALQAAKFSPENPVIRAARFVVRCRQRFGGGQPGQAMSDTVRCWGTTRKTGRKYLNDNVSKWLSVMLELPRVHRRLATVVIDSQDAIRCIGQWDTSQTLFYCDPPYIGHEAYYQGGFDDTAHKRLAEALNGIAGRAVLSYYPHALVDKYYPKDRWHRIAIRTIATASGNRKHDPGDTTIQAARPCQYRTELVLMNFDPRSRRRLGHSVRGKSA